MCDSSAGGQPVLEKFLYQHRLLQEGVQDAAVADESFWVKCDLCKKWRAMPIGHKVTHLSADTASQHLFADVPCTRNAASWTSLGGSMTLLGSWQKPEEKRWICTMHPDPEIASCDVEEEQAHEVTRYSEHEGYVQPGEPQGQQANVEYFQRMAEKHLEVWHIRHVLPWLAHKRHDHDTLLAGIKASHFLSYFIHRMRGYQVCMHLYWPCLNHMLHQTGPHNINYGARVVAACAK